MASGQMFKLWLSHGIAQIHVPDIVTREDMSRLRSALMSLVQEKPRSDDQIAELALERIAGGE